MIKTTILSLTTLVALLINYLYTNEVNLYAKYPTEVKAGENFDVVVTVEKGNLSEFGRFTQTLPEGFSAESKNKLFSFSDSKVKFLWITLPASSNYTFSYTIHVPASFSGESTLEGHFSYITDNEKKISSLPPYTIVVKPSDTPDSEINRSDSYASNTENGAPNETVVTASRQIAESNGAFIVKINVDKKSLIGMAKITETIPNGYTAEVIDNGKAVFTQEGNIVKFLWMNMDTEPVMDVSYLLTKQNPTTTGSPVVSGNFSYSSSGITKTVQIIDNPKKAQLSDDEIASAQVHVNVPDKESYSTNVTYKVQIAAGHKLVNAKTHFKKFKIFDKVTVTQHDGWHKYTIGKFPDYKSARDYRVSVWSNTMAKDAFVAAYNGNTRITVQEALMIANHKWYQ